MIAEQRSKCVHHKLLSFCAQCLAHNDGTNVKGDHESRLQFQMFQLCEAHGKYRGVGACVFGVPVHAAFCRHCSALDVPSFPWCLGHSCW